MCTAASYKGIFGRNLDYDFGYGQKILITPRNFPLSFNHVPQLNNHYAIIGAGIIEKEYPMYFDAINEKGLGVAGLNFVGNCVYHEAIDGKTNIAQYELIPYILSTCANVKEVKELYKNLNIDNEVVSDRYSPAQLHWFIADKESSIVLETVKDGLKLYDNPVNVLTNNPPFNMQLFNLNNYAHLSKKDPVNSFGIELTRYSRGMGAMGLPGDLSSMSRFVKVAFTNHFSESLNDDHLNQFFHILHSVEQQNGCCEVKDRSYEYTIYSSACDLDKGIYYYTTYENHQITAVNMHSENLDGKKLIRYPLILGEQIKMQN